LKPYLINIWFGEKQAAAAPSQSNTPGAEQPKQMEV
jgi:hypothetical protein